MARPQCDTPPLVEQVFTLALIQIQFFHPFGRVGFVCASLGRCVCVCVCACVFLFICLVLLFWRGDAREAAMAGWAMGMRGAWAWYQSRLLQQPVRTQMVTSGILWAAGDAMAQSVSRLTEKRSAARDNSTTTIVCARSLSVCVCVSLSVCVSPICCRNLNHYYQSLNFLFWAQFGVLNLNQKIRV
jgi:hypothetical protein